MFAIARSVFWLTAAYLVIKPGVDLPDTAALSRQAMAAGAQVIATQVATLPCDSLQCVGGRAVVSALIEPSISAAAPMHVSAVNSAAPYPMPRPAWLNTGHSNGA